MVRKALFLILVPALVCAAFLAGWSWSFPIHTIIAVRPPCRLIREASSIQAKQNRSTIIIDSDKTSVKTPTGTFGGIVTGQNWGFSSRSIQVDCIAVALALELYQGVLMCISRDHVRRSLNES